MSIDRRQFLWIAAAGVSAGVVGVRLTPRRVPAFRALAEPELLALLGPHAVHEIGAHYLAAEPVRRTAAALRDLAWGAAPGHDLAARVAARVRADFAAGRTVLVNGWVLSVTEARQCALFSLLTA